MYNNEFILAVAMIVGYIYIAVCLTRIANKTGQDFIYWYAWVPVLNVYLVCKMADISTIGMITLLIPVINVMMFAFLWMKIAEFSGFQFWWGLLMLVPIVNLFVIGYMAFGKQPEQSIGRYAV